MMNQQEFNEFAEFAQMFSFWQQWKQMSNPQPQPLPQMMQEQTPTVTFEQQGITQDVQGQLKSMAAEIESLKAQLAEAKEKATNEAQRANVAERELGMLKTDIKVVEKFYGKTLFEMAADAETVSGDDYYGDHKQEWDEQGLTNEQKHEKVKEFRDAAIAFADNALEGDMIQF